MPRFCSALPQSLINRKSRRRRPGSARNHRDDSASFPGGPESRGLSRSESCPAPLRSCTVPYIGGSTFLPFKCTTGAVLTDPRHCRTTTTSRGSVSRVRSFPPSRPTGPRSSPVIRTSSPPASKTAAFERVLPSHLLSQLNRLARPTRSEWFCCPNSGRAARAYITCPLAVAAIRTRNQLSAALSDGTATSRRR
jgi:hypothetical protein